MESIEPLDVVNQRLVDYFGRAWDNRPIWRIVWSEDQFEKQLTAYSEHGILLLHPEWRLVPKYRQWIQSKFILERLVVVPEINANDVTEKTSYEPVWTFEDKNGEALPYKWEAAEFVIKTLYAAIGKESMRAKYIDPEIENPVEQREQRVKKLEDDLFGNETTVGDALAYKQAIVVPHNYKGDS